MNQGISVVLDATNLAERYRIKLYNIAKRINAKFILVKTDASPNIVRERLEARKFDSLNLSDANWNVYLDMRPRAEKVRHEHFVVDTTKDILPMINRIINEINK